MIKNWTEKIVNIFTIIGVIAAIMFSGYQSYLLRMDMELRDRPYIKIEFDEDRRITKELRFLNYFTVKKEEFVLFFHFEENETAYIVFPIKIKNVGNYPARITDLEIFILDSKGDTKFTKDRFKMVGKKDFQYIIFPNDTESIGYERGFFPESDDVIPDFNKNFSEIEALLKKENFFVQVKVGYKIFNENQSKRKFFFDNRKRNFTSIKSWRVRPGGKEYESYHYDIK